MKEKIFAFSILDISGDRNAIAALKLDMSHCGKTNIFLAMFLYVLVQLEKIKDP